MKFNRIRYTIAVALLVTIGTAQQEKQVWTIDECVNYALENNIQVRQSQLQVEINKNVQQVAEWDYAPNLNLNSTYGWNFGLNIDPVTNQISQSQRQTASLGLSSNWVLYDGGRKYNNIARSNLDYLASLYGLEAVKNDIRLNVSSAFLQVLLNKEILAVAQEQERITELQVRRMERLVEAGARPRGDQLQLEAQLARDKQNRIAADNAVTISKLQLANLLQLDAPDEFNIIEPQMELPEADLLVRDPSFIYATAVDNQPSVKSAEKQLESSEESIDISKSGWLPTLSINGQVATSYSDQIQQPSASTTATVPVAIYDQNGEVVFVQQTQVIPTDFEDKAVFDQFNDNLNEYLGISLTVPIFNRFTARNNYQNAKIDREISQLRLEQEKNTLKQTIYQAHADAKASYNSYLAAEKSVEAGQESFKYAEERYNVGALSQFDYEDARNSLAAAKSEMLRSKYDYIFKIKVLEFYLTNQIKL